MNRNELKAKLETTKNALTYGIEIEWTGQTTGTTRSQIAAAVATAVNGTVRHTNRGLDRREITAQDGRTWLVVSDSSVRGSRRDRTENGTHGGEVVSPILTRNDTELLGDVIKAVRDAGGRPDSSCGIHIHVGVQSFDAKSLARLARYVYSNEEILFAALGVRGRRHSWAKDMGVEMPGFISYLKNTKPAKLTTANFLNAHYTDNRDRSHYSRTRYHGLNFNNVVNGTTVEFRYFNASLHRSKIGAYVELVLGLAAKAIVSKGGKMERKVYDAARGKWQVRTMLIELGLSGDEYKAARKYLAARLDGDSAYSAGRPAANAANPVEVMAETARDVFGATA